MLVFASTSTNFPPPQTPLRGLQCSPDPNIGNSPKYRGARRIMSNLRRTSGIVPELAISGIYQQRYLALLVLELSASIPEMLIYNIVPVLVYQKRTFLEYTRIVGEYSENVQSGIGIQETSNSTLSLRINPSIAANSTSLTITNMLQQQYCHTNR